MSLENLIRQRREKIEKWRAIGVPPYAYGYEPTHHAQELLARGDAVTQDYGEVVKIAGRVMTLRGHGKAGFAHVLDGSGKLQVYFKQDVLQEHFARYELLDVGDWVGIEGPLFRTRAGEITVRADRIELLAKSLRPLPEKWHGLKDPETRYRQRYADLFVNLDVRETFRKRATLIASLRRTLESHDFLEVETPVLQPLYGGAFARPFATRHHALDMELYLRISNELYLKRLIVGGLERVYEFSRDFRNEGMDRTHNPEFTMLEFYQAFTDVHGMMALTEELFVRAVEAVVGAGAGHTVVYQGETLDFTPPFRRVSMLDAVSAKVGEDVRDLDAAKLARLAAKHRVTPPRHGDATGPAPAGVLLDALFSELVQPELRQPTFLVDYPIETSPLARASRTNPDVVERFELFVAGTELANAFSEQNDPDAQRRAFELQVAARAQGDEEAQPMDLDYVRALEYGMPPTGGCGIGIDRLTMMLTDQRSIRDVLLFPQLRPEEGRPVADESEAIEVEDVAPESGAATAPPAHRPPAAPPETAPASQRGT
jgi:lysyl-tRNA synthetase, class II